MDIKVDKVQQTQALQQTQDVKPTDGSFKFTLASHVSEAELQTRLQGLMEEITMQGERLYKKRDVRDMKKYRSLIKEFMNEVVSRSHSFARELFSQLYVRTIPLSLSTDIERFTTKNPSCTKNSSLPENVFFCAYSSKENSFTPESSAPQSSHTAPPSWK